MKRIKLEITAQSPLAIGRQKPGGSISEVETYIPGTVIRGAVAGLMIRQGQAQKSNFAEDPDSDFKALFIDGGAIFQNAYPALAEVDNYFQTNSEIRVLPATALSAKGKSGFYPKGNGVFDSLIDRFYADKYGQVYDPSCPKDGGRVDPYKTFYSRYGDHYHPHSSSTRLLTRVGINRRRATAEDDFLYSIQVLDEVKTKSNCEPVPMVFCSNILVEVKESVEKDFFRYLKHNSTNIRLGGSASRGLGKVSLDPEEPADIKSEVSDRILAFNKVFQKRWQFWQIFDRSQSNPTADRTFFTIGLQSDAILREQWQRSTVISANMLQALAGNIPGDLRLESAYSSYDYRSGWNSAWGLMKDTELITDRGSVYLFSVETVHQKDWISALEGLENRGIGDRTMEGFGQVRICDEFHCILRENAV
jgi:CRISPR-associated protein Csx10